MKLHDMDAGLYPEISAYVCKQGVVVVYGLMYECIVVCMYKCVI